MKKSMSCVTVLAGLAAAASGQTGGTYIIDVTHGGGWPGTTVLYPIATISIWAAWDSGDHLFGGGNYDLNAGEAGWTTANLALGVDPPNTAGVINGASVQGAAIGQVHIPNLNIIGNPDNPILLATYEWMTTDFTNRSVSLSTSNTNNFVVSSTQTGATTQLYPGNFTPGKGSINAGVPAPSALAVVGLGGLVASRRRR